MNIKFKFHQPSFLKNDFSELFKSNGNFKAIFKEEGMYSWNDFLNASRNEKLVQNCLESNLQEFFSLNSLSLLDDESKGLYLVENGLETENELFKTTNQKEKTNQEGLNNHIHFDTVIKSRIYQYMFAGMALINWANRLRVKRSQSNYHFYLTGIKNYTTCIYSDSSAIESLDSSLNEDGELFCSDYDEFFKWIYFGDF